MRTLKEEEEGNKLHIGFSIHVYFCDILLGDVAFQQYSCNIIIKVDTATVISSVVVLWTESGCKEGPPLSLGVIR